MGRSKSRRLEVGRLATGEFVASSLSSGIWFEQEDEPITIEQTKQQYPNQWVLIEFTTLDDDLSVVDGEVLAHSPGRDEIEKGLTKLRNEKIAVEFTGEGDAGEAYLIGAIAKALNVENRSKVN